LTIPERVACRDFAVESSVDLMRVSVLALAVAVDAVDNRSSQRCPSGSIRVKIP
jgi:hypothetical protein